MHDAYGYTEAPTLASLRGDLSQLREVLLQTLDKHGCDQIELDGERVLCRVLTISTARITRLVLTEVLGAAVGAVTAGATEVDALTVFAFSKQALHERIDKSAWKGNLLPVDSVEATRKSRAGVPVRRGGRELLSESAKELCEAYWIAMGLGQAALQEAKATRAAERSAKQEAQTESAPPSPPASPPQGVRTPLPTPPPPPLPPAAAAASKPRARKLKTLNKKPINNVSKRLAWDILERCADAIAAGAREATEMEEIVSAHWPSR